MGLCYPPKRYRCGLRTPLTDQNRHVRNHLQQDEKDFLNTVNDLLAYAGADPTPEERNDGISDQYEFQQQLKDLKGQNASLWTRYGLR